MFQMQMRKSKVGQTVEGICTVFLHQGVTNLRKITETCTLQSTKSLKYDIHTQIYGTDRVKTDGFFFVG